MSANKCVVGLGELLWDLLPDGPRLGGAVSNFAVMAARLGSDAVIASRVGADALGRRAMEELSNTPVDTSCIQQDFSHVTGAVSVTLKEGQPQYVIHEPVAWDFLEFTPAWLGLARRADAVCFGTLAQREHASRRTIEGFLGETRKECVRVFDANLRAPFFGTEVIEKSLELATILKVNADEMPTVLHLLGFPPSEKTTPQSLQVSAHLLLDQFPIELVVITLGAAGSLLITRREVHRHPGHPTQLVDAIGAGDAFTAALTTYYLGGAPLAVLSEAGNRWGAWMASQPGAMPTLPSETRERIGALIASTPHA